MDVLHRMLDIRKKLGDIMYTRDAPEDVIDDMRFVLDSFDVLQKLLDELYKEHAKEHVELELNRRVLIASNPPEKVEQSTPPA